MPSESQARQARGANTANQKERVINANTVTTAVLALLLAVALFDRDLALKLVAVIIPIALFIAGFIFSAFRFDPLRLLIIKQILSQRKILQNEKSPFTKFLLGVVASLGGKKPKLYAFQSTLPKLPVPSLDSTLQKYLKSVKPLLTETEFENTQQIAKEFQKGVGASLQQQLVQFAKTRDNWVEEWWEKYAYLSNREPLVPYTNYYGTDRIDPLDVPQIKRLAEFIKLILTFKNLIDTEALEAIRILDVVPIDMYQYSRMFSTVRVPEDPCDRIVTYKKEESKHIIVIRNGHLFKLDTVQDGKSLTASEYEKQLEQIVHITPEEEPFSVGALTSENRSTWARLRKKLVEDGNQETLQSVESALFVVVLEVQEPSSLEEIALSGLIGNGKNRWYDKSFQMIMFQNGKLSLNCEHSWADAPVMVHLFDYVFGLEGSKTEEETSTRELTPPQKLKWHLTDEIKTAITEANVKLQQVVQHSVDIKVLIFDHFGKGLIKQFKVSPDGFVQMALQLTYYRLYGHSCLTYESAHTRQFYHGRTETVRSASVESLEFCKAMAGPEAANYTVQDRLALLKKAIHVHLAYMRDCMEGQGIDRHLFGLRVLSSQLPEMPQFFKDKGWQFNYQLSTSQTPAHRTTGGGFAPTAKDGYGVSYIVAEDRLTFHISTYQMCPETSGQRFSDLLSLSLLDMRALAITTPKMRQSLSKGELSQE